MSSAAAVHAFDHVVIGGGIVGLSVAARLSSFGSTLLLERRPVLLSETSTHNSGVIHSGMYYPEASLKTKLCIEGNRWMWRQLRQQAEKEESSNNGVITARKCGKWIVATNDSEVEKLHTLQQALEKRGMPWRFVSRSERTSKEPELSCCECLESCDTGIVDVHSLAAFFENQLQATSSSSSNDFLSLVMKRTEPVSFECQKQSGKTRMVLSTRQPTAADQDAVGDKTTVEAGAVINCAGLFASRVAAQLRRGGADESTTTTTTTLPRNMQQRFCRGCYASYPSTISRNTSATTVSSSTEHRKKFLSRLVYPCPVENLAGLGTHSVIDTADSTLLFGPNVDWIFDDDDANKLLDSDVARYRFPSSTADVVDDGGSGDSFLDGVHESVTKYLPRLDRSKLQRAFVGIRPKLSGPGEPAADFYIAVDEEIRSRSGCVVVQCLGIESPGLTASPAIGRYVAELLGY